MYLIISVFIYKPDAQSAQLTIPFVIRITGNISINLTNLTFSSYSRKINK